MHLDVPLPNSAGELKGCDKQSHCPEHAMNDHDPAYPSVVMPERRMGVQQLNVALPDDPDCE
jgi:hypothetical protein